MTDPVSICSAQVRAYPGAAYTRQCQRHARVVGFVPDDKGDVIRNDVRGVVRPFCGLHDPQRTNKKALTPASITPHRDFLFRGVAIRLDLDRASILAKLIVRGSQNGGGLLESDCRSVIERFRQEDASRAATARAQPVTTEEVKDMFG